MRKRENDEGFLCLRLVRKLMRKTRTEETKQKDHQPNNPTKKTKGLEEKKTMKREDVMEQVGLCDHDQPRTTFSPTSEKKNHQTAERRKKKRRNDGGERRMEVVVGMVFVGHQKFLPGSGRFLLFNVIKTKGWTVYLFPLKNLRTGGARLRRSATERTRTMWEWTAQEMQYWSFMYILGRAYPVGGAKQSKAKQEAKMMRITLKHKKRKEREMACG